MKEERSKAKIWNLSLKSWKERAFNENPNPSYSRTSIKKA